MIVQDPEGRPDKTTLPVGTDRVGWVIVPTTGGAGVGGCAGITTLSEGIDVQPASLVTV